MGWLTVCLNALSASSNDSSCDTKLVDWPVSYMNSLRKSSNEECLGGWSYDEGLEDGLLNCGYLGWCSP